MNAPTTILQIPISTPAAQAAAFVPAAVTGAFAMHDAIASSAANLPDRFALAGEISPATRPLPTPGERIQLAHRIDSLFKVKV